MRRGLGRGRTLIAIGSILAIIGMWLPWRSSGGAVLEVATENGFETAGVATFLASVGMLALIVAPYATRNRQLALDRAAVYAVLAVVGIGGVAAVAVSLIAPSQEGVSYHLMPFDAPGLWLAIAGMALASWGVLELFAEKPAAP